MNRRSGNLILTYVFLAFVSPIVIAQVRLPRLVGDGMVLQREVETRVWGWASSGEHIALEFADSTYQTTSDSSGNWKVRLAAHKGGGPFDMRIKASNEIVLHDILFGDVWICSGQSNMELPMSRVSPIYSDVIASSTNSFIRQFYVPQKYDFVQTHMDVDSGKWLSAGPQTILKFSAVAYFFGKAVYEKYHVPIGLINASLGGSPAESWICEEALKAFPAYYSEADRFKDEKLIRDIEQSDKKRIDAWYDELKKKDDGYKNPSQPWFDPSLKTQGWEEMNVPGYWADTKLGPLNGVVWFRKEFDVQSSMVGKPAMLILGRIVDADSVFVNGIFVGTTSYQYPPRRYPMPSDILNKGKNLIVVRVINSGGKGGFVPDKQYAIVAGSETIDLKGAWQCRVGATMNPLAAQTFIRWIPAGLFNGMIAPLLNYRIKGVIWYQGESNASRPADYTRLLSTLISDWRGHWDEGDFPFLFVQLPNFLEAKAEPSESNWASLREAQMKTLAVPNTAMAVTIDIGEWNDIHPLDKKDVGERLALAAEHTAYGDTGVVSSGPLYNAMTINDNKVEVTFTHIGGGLLAKGGTDLKGFAIAGTDKKFVWAHARIENDRVIVWSAEVEHPLAVRYAWADNPAGANLYNQEGLPASPFRTDDWTAK